MDGIGGTVKQIVFNAVKSHHTERYWTWPATIYWGYHQSTGDGGSSDKASGDYEASCEEASCDQTSGGDAVDIHLGRWYAVYWDPTQFWYIGEAQHQKDKYDYQFSFLEQVSPTRNVFTPVKNPYTETLYWLKLMLLPHCPPPEQVCWSWQQRISLLYSRSLCSSSSLPF